jgi:hypothetical protein
MLTVRAARGGTFLKEIRARIKDFSSRPVVAGRIVVPDSLRWWYWLEFGTAMSADPGRGVNANARDDGRYPIRPKNTNALSWSSPEGKKFRTIVWHPGIKSRHIVLNALPDIMDQAAKDLHRTVSGNSIRSGTFLNMLLTDTMRFAKGAIVQSMDERTSPNIRRKNRIPDSVASQEFEANATIQGLY